MKGIFVTGTDTGVGKTVVVGLLARFLKEKGYRVITQKWVQTGDKEFSSDINTHLKIMKSSKKDIKQYLSLICPYIFKLPASPHLAADKEKKIISVNKIKTSFRRLAKNFDFVIVEGVGGALVPFNKSKLVIDIAKDLKLPALVVSANKLGAINHTLLTIEAVRSRKMKLLGVVFNNIYPKTDQLIIEDNPRIVKAISREMVLGVLPHSKDADWLYRKFVPIVKGLCRERSRPFPT